jgi:hypothetical protein
VSPLPRAGEFLKHDAHGFGVKRRDVFETLGANQAKLVVGRLRREEVYWTFGLAGFSFSSFSAFWHSLNSRSTCLTSSGESS